MPTDGPVKIQWSGILLETDTLEEAAQVCQVLYKIAYNKPTNGSDTSLFVAALKGTAKNEAARLLGRLGGLKGGLARARALSPEKRSEIAARAAHARWQKTKRV